MFNLIVSGNDEAWEAGEPYVLDASRVVKQGEYTAPEIAAELGSLDAGARQRLLQFPTLFAYEGVREDRFARLGRVTRIQALGGQVRLEYRFDENVPPIPSQIFEDLRWELEIGGWEMSRTHWAVKDADLLRILTERGIVPAEAVGEPPLEPGEEAEEVRTDPHIRPSVFRIPAQAPEADLVAVMMPFHDDFADVYVAIRNAVEAEDLRCQRALDIFDEPEIIQDVFSLLYRSRAVICDFSGRNANVFYEAGIAHTLGRDVIPLVQDMDHVPFDLRHHRHIVYAPSVDGLDRLTNDLRRRIGVIAAR
ncbi:MAG: hypothetical protein REJ23_00265 [Brevundimonas sp.]|nr:hypothetical protein [Brevundimonas sp.]